MAVQKPQKALTVNDQEIFPLTCADQIIMDDGSRLNAAMEKFLVPAYASADYGKVLSCTAGGLEWVEAVSTTNLTDIEEVAF